MAVTISSSNIVLRPTVRSASEIPQAQTNAVPKEESPPSVGDILSQRMKIMRQASRDMLSKLNTVSESRKAAARQRLEQAKQRIKMLKMLVSSGLASKGVLREIRALAKELGQVAKELSGYSPAVDASENTDVSTSAQEGDVQQTVLAGDERVASNTLTESDSEAEDETELKSDSAIEAETGDESSSDDEIKQQAGAAEREANSLGAYFNNHNNANANQRRQDAESIKEVLSLLKSLVNMVKNMGWNDTEFRKEMEKINSLLSETESIATDMSGGSLGGLSLGSIVSVNV